VDQEEQVVVKLEMVEEMVEQEVQVHHGQDQVITQWAAAVVLVDMLVMVVLLVLEMFLPVVVLRVVMLLVVLVVVVLVVETQDLMLVEVEV